MKTTSTHRVSLEEAYVRNYSWQLPLGGIWWSRTGNSLSFPADPLVLVGCFLHACISFKKRKYCKEVTNIVHCQVSRKPAAGSNNSVCCCAVALLCGVLGCSVL